MSARMTGAVSIMGRDPSRSGKVMRVTCQCGQVLETRDKIRFHEKMGHGKEKVQWVDAS